MTVGAFDRDCRPIRLTYLITDLEVGGVPLHLYRLATRLPKERFCVHVISLAQEGPVGEMLRKIGIPVDACGARHAGDVASLGRLWRMLVKNPPDILHAFLFHANTAARIVGPMAGVPTGRIICEIQTVEQERRWHLVVDNITCRLSRWEVGNSRSVVAHLHRRAHVPKSRLRCEPGAVDVEAIASAVPASRADLGVSPDEPLVIWAGRLDPVKGFEEMIAGFSQACRKRPAQLILVGDGPYRPMIEKLVSESGMASRILLLGQRDDVASLLKVADLFLFSSRTEGMPNAVLEAMAAGLPILATDVPGCRDLIVHGQTGILVPPRSADAIAHGIDLLLNDPDWGRALGPKAFAWAKKHVDVRQLAQRWTGIYESLIRLPGGFGVTW